MRKVKKAYAITDAKISFVSLVNKAANKRNFIITRAAGGNASFTTTGKIIKADAKNHYVTGVVYEPLEEDAHGNYMTEDEILKAAYWYAENGNKVDLQHSFQQLDGAKVVESWVAKADFSVDGQTVKKGTWLMTIKVPEGEIWDEIQKGQITGLSMGGVGAYSTEDVTITKAGRAKKDQETEESAQQNREQSEPDDAQEDGQPQQENEQQEQPEEEGGQPQPASAQEEDDMENQDTKKRREVQKSGRVISSKNFKQLQAIHDQLGKFLASYDPGEDTASVTTSGAAGQAGTTAAAEAAITKQKEEHALTRSEVEVIIADAIAKAISAPDAAQNAQNGSQGVSKAAGEEQGTADGLTQEDVQNMVTQAISKALQPAQKVSKDEVETMIQEAVQKAVEPILNSRGVPSNLNGEQGITKNAEDHYLKGIL